MEEDWPFYHLNLVSPTQSPIQPLNPSQDLSPLAFDSRQLEAWSNINFNFDESPYVTNNNNNPSDSLQSVLDCSVDPFGLIQSNVRVTGTADNDSEGLLDPISTILLGQPTVDRPEIFQQSAPKPSLAKPSTHQSTQPQLESSDQIQPSPLSAVCRTQLDSSSGTSNPFSANQSNTRQPKKSDQKPENSPQADEDDGSRGSHEDDKRRRNTLASARFRMKKKMKEQEIERTAKEMKERVSELEKEVENLKQENKWLRGLIVDQAASKASSSQASQKRSQEAEPMSVALDYKRSKVD